MTLYPDLILNLALLVALSTISGFFGKRLTWQSPASDVLQGILFGATSILGMMRPLTLGPGLIFDGRSVMVSLCALYFGPRAAVIALALPVFYRVHLGGAGALTGALVTLSSMAIGLLAHFYLKPHTRSPSVRDLYGLGLIVHLAMLAMMFTLPEGKGLSVVMHIGVPVLILFPLATVLAGKILSDQADARANLDELRERQERYKLLFNSGNDAIFVRKLAEGPFVEVNDIACSRLEYSREELLRLSSRDIDSVEMEAVRLKVIETLARTGYAVFETAHITRSGKTIPVEISTRVFEYKGERYALSIARDITDRKRGEEEHARLQAQFTQAQKMESVGRLAGGVAHDFNNMLMVILGHIDLMMDQLDASDPIFNDLMEIQTAAKRSAELTQNLLGFARKQTVAPKAIDVNITIEGMFNILKRLIGESIHLSWIPGKDLWLTRMDPSQLDQIMANLCVNSRDAISGIGKITIGTRNMVLDHDFCLKNPGANPGDFVMLSVSDTGCGMDEATKNRLFEPFFTTKELGKGTGLGLSTVYGIVKQNDGYIEVQSELNLGTTIRIYLPRVIAPAERIPDPIAPAVEEHSCGTILLVEDEQAVLHLTNRLLGKQGFNVLSASSPGEAIRVAMEHSGEIHLLITDVIMPQMNGKDLAKTLLSRYPAIRTLFMSGYTANLISKDGMMEDGVEFIQKPFSNSDFIQKVQKILNRSV